MTWGSDAGALVAGRVVGARNGVNVVIRNHLSSADRRTAMEPRHTPTRRMRWGRAEKEALVAFGLGAAVAVAVTLTPLSWVAGVLVGWDCVALGYTARLAVVFRRWDAGRTKSRAMST